ncbi:hypothetical protein PGTUg99_050196 [Puccinia graminis f. sp. tritici]|uniref:HAT C-terminal dimerisation domain-containing protein n=1 Tax=Puccinia graminis f. sp. tritici TaxID=56615 RepID=A0A5B0LHS9_PUCGR|nr:hypothetical protein PGTUg99_050196 [Puccinia graminis f. sp. tritici]
MTKYPTAHHLYYTMKKIDKHLKDAIKNGSKHIVALIAPMQQKYNKYWMKMSDFAAINLVFDPRCKLELIDFLLSDKFGTETAATTLKHIKTKIYNWFDNLTRQQNKQTNQEATTGSNTKRSKSTEDNNVDDRFKAYLAGKKTTQNATSPSAKLDLYLQESTVDINSPSFEILTWWKVNSVRFPTLASMEKVILMVPMKSIASESAFSTGGRVLSDYCSQLKPGTLEALICAQDWIYHKEGLYEFNQDEHDNNNEAEVLVIS